jgi:hypothetical protein
MTNAQKHEQIAEKMPVVIERAKEIIRSMADAGMAKVMTIEDAIPLALSSAVQEELGFEVITECVHSTGTEMVVSFDLTE